MDKNEYLKAINRATTCVGVKATTKDELFHRVAEMLLEDGVITSIEGFVKDLYEREALGSTGIGEGVAIPHGKSESVVRTCISVIKTAEPLTWETADGEPAHVFLVFAVKAEDSTDYHLRLLAQVATRLAQEGTCANLVKAETADELIAALS